MIGETKEKKIGREEWSCSASFGECRELQFEREGFVFFFLFCLREEKNKEGSHFTKQPEPSLGAISFLFGYGPFPLDWVAHHFCNFSLDIFNDKMLVSLAHARASYFHSVHVYFIYCMCQDEHRFMLTWMCTSCMFHNLHNLCLNMSIFLCGLHGSYCFDVSSHSHAQINYYMLIWKIISTELHMASKDIGSRVMLINWFLNSSLPLEM